MKKLTFIIMVTSIMFIYQGCESNSTASIEVPSQQKQSPEQNVKTAQIEAIQNKINNQKITTRGVSSHSNTFTKKDNYTIIDILYGTDRKVNKEEKKYFYEEYYSAHRGKLKYGVAQVTIPIKHKYGKMERPNSNILFFEEEDENEHIIVKKLDELSQEKFMTILKTKLQNVSSKDIMVFIHGFNNTFGDALRRTAQLTYDLKFKGIPVTYSWPSEGDGISTYMQDESSVQYTTPHLVTFLSSLIENKSDDAKIHILGHSMGTRALTNAIKEISYIYRGQKVFSNIILAAPDIDRDVFEVSLLPYIKKTADMLTLYASSDDSALKASKTLHGGTRLGLSEDIFVFDGLNTIDATGIDTSSLGHSYFVEKKIIIEDLKEMIYRVLPPQKRVKTLEQRYKDKFIYWKVKQVSN